VFDRTERPDDARIAESKVPVYVYENVKTGERYEIVAAMSVAPTNPIEINGATLRRVYDHTLASAKEQGIVPGASGVPISRTLPRVRSGGRRVNVSGTAIYVHRDGLRTDGMGHPIVANRKDREAVERRFSVKRES